MDRGKNMESKSFIQLHLSSGETKGFKNQSCHRRWVRVHTSVRPIQKRGEN